MKTILQRLNFAGRSQIRYQILPFLCTLLISIPAFPQGENWRIISEQPTPRHEIGSCVVDGKIYSIGGMSHEYNPGSQTFFSMVTVFDPETGVWDTCQSMPGPRTGLFASAINGKIYAFGGRRSHNTENLKVVEIYDIEKDEWSTGTSMPNGAAYAAGCVLDGRIYIIGGLQQSGWMATNQLLRYNPVEDSWETLEGMNTARGGFSANIVNGKIYAIGGADNPNIAFNVVEEYDPAMNDWVEKTAMPSKRGFHAGVVVNDRIWVMSGTENFTTVKTTVEIYDPVKDTWSSAVKEDNPLVGFWGPASVAINSKVYLYAGSGAPEFSDVPDVIEFDFPVVRSRSGSWLTSKDSLLVEFYEEGTLYIVPDGTPAYKDSILKYQIGTFEGVANQLITIQLDTVPSGGYEIIGIASDGRLDRGHSTFHIDMVEISDANFLNALIDEEVDTNGDSLISYAEAEEINALNVSERGISDMTGIEAFVNLDTLLCEKNSLTSLDISNNTALTLFACKNNKLSSLDVSNNTALKGLWCETNKLTTLDVSNNLNLESVRCSNNYLRNRLDISNCSSLIDLDCSENQLTSLDVSSSNVLETLYCGGNILSRLDISNNTALGYLGIWDMPTLHEVCVWETPFPPKGVDIDTTGSPNVCFEIDCNGTCVTGLMKFKQEEIIIFPNPTNELLTIETVTNRQHSIEITSMNGQLIFSTKMEGTTHQIDLTSFQKGVYFITIRSKDFETTKKIIKL